MDKKALSASKTYTDEKLKNYQCGNVSIEKTTDGGLIFYAQKGTANESKVEFSKSELMSDSEYDEIITTPSNTWSIQHNLDAPFWKLTVCIIDGDNNTTEGNVDLDASTNNLLVLKFTDPISGQIYIKK